MKEHRFVNHSKEYAKDGVHVNTAENRHGFLRAWLIKFRGVSKHYLGKYISSKETWFRIHHSVPDGLEMSVFFNIFFNFVTNILHNFGEFFHISPFSFVNHLKIHLFEP